MIGVSQYVKNRANTNGTSTGRSAHSAKPLAMKVRISRHAVCTRRSARLWSALDINAPHAAATSHALRRGTWILVLPAPRRRSKPGEKGRWGSRFFPVTASGPERFQINHGVRRGANDHKDDKRMCLLCLPYCPWDWCSYDFFGQMFCISIVGGACAVTERQLKVCQNSGRLAFNR